MPASLEYLEFAKTISATLVTISHTLAEKSPWTPVLTSLVTTTFGLIGGFLLSQSKEHQKEKKQKQLVHNLLRDEIEMRWEQNFESWCSAIASAQGFERLKIISTVELNRNDLPVIKMVTDKFWDFHFIGDTDFMSAIVFGATLLSDLVDARASARNLLTEYSSKPFLRNVDGLVKPDEIAGKVNFDAGVNGNANYIGKLMSDLTANMVDIHGRLLADSRKKRAPKVPGATNWR